jgi:hypothetical protein
VSEALKVDGARYIQIHTIRTATHHRNDELTGSANGHRLVISASTKKHALRNCEDAALRLRTIPMPGPNQFVPASSASRMHAQRILSRMPMAADLREMDLPDDGGDERASAVVKTVYEAIVGAGALDDPAQVRGHARHSNMDGRLASLGDDELELMVQLSGESLAQWAEQWTKTETVTPQKLARQVVDRWAAEHGERFRKQPLACGIENAVFGRPDYHGHLQHVPAAMVVAHEQSVHAVGPGLVGSGVFYGYLAIDCRRLVENIERKATDSEIAADVVRRIILMAARLPLKAHGDQAMLTIVEVGDQEPLTFAEAFDTPVPGDRSDSWFVPRAYDQLANFIRSLDREHPTSVKRAMAIVNLAHPSTLPDVIPTHLGDRPLADWSIATANAQGQRLPSTDAA